tara:strand:- start:779 stop:1759 length:981 start_codon:yes stop_codon:yes gene_type:complete
LKLPDYSDVVDAADRLRSISRVTPLLRHPVIDEKVGVPVYLKAEPLQVTGSFKIRGAYNRICRLTSEERENGVVAFSSGNHAQGVARAARLIGIKARIVMPSDTPKIKIDGVKRDGAEIIFYDRFTENRESIAAQIADDENCVIVSSYDDFHVIAGQGSCGLEIVKDWPEDTPPQMMACCVGGGGLISGSSLAIHHHWPGTKIYGVEPLHFDSTGQSLRSGERTSIDYGQKSICDALLSPSPGELTLAINQQHLAGGIAVTDDEVREAMRVAFKTLKIVVEPGGAAALASVLAGRIPLNSDQPIVVVMTGGNVDPALYADILMSAD